MLPIATIVEADLDRPEHRHDVVMMTAACALDAMGNGGPLSPDVLDRLGTGPATRTRRSSADCR
jgi:hypothetical protein